MNRFYIIIILFSFCSFVLIAPLEAEDLLHNWLEVPKSEYGIQVWDKLSLENNKDGSIRILSKFIPNTKNETASTILYTMDINCSQKTFKDVYLGQNKFEEFKNPSSDWKDPNGDQLILGVIDQVCSFNNSL